MVVRQVAKTGVNIDVGYKGRKSRKESRRGKPMTKLWLYFIFP